MTLVNLVKVTLVSLIVIVSILECHGVEIIIDNEADLARVEGSTGSTCSYIEEYSSLCKTGISNPGAGVTGFWSSCETNSCEISISVVKLGDFGLIPSKVRVKAYVEAPDAQIRIRYKRTPSSGAINMQPAIENTNDWVESVEFDLEAINPPLTTTAEIIVRVSSGPIPESRDILDQIIFTFPDDSSPTPPPPQDVIIDNTFDLANVDGDSTCTYSEPYGDICKEGLSNPGETGFWSSCMDNACEISIRLGRIGGLEMVPSSVRVLAWVEAPNAQIRLRYRRSASGGIVNMQPVIENTLDWVESQEYDLEAIDPPLTPEAIIVIRLSSGPMEASIDVLDKIIFKVFGDPIPPTTPVVTPVPTTACTFITTDGSTISTTPSLPETTEEPGPIVTIDTLAHWAAVEGTINTCTYMESHSAICKRGTSNTPTTGFWSSCDDNSCEISVSLGKLGGRGEVPTKVRALVWVESPTGLARFRYKVTPTSNSVNMRPDIENTNGWAETEDYDLTAIPTLTPDSEIVIRLQSAPLPENIDILDKIIFEFPPDPIVYQFPPECTPEPPESSSPTAESESTSTTESSTTTTESTQSTVESIPTQEPTTTTTTTQRPEPTQPITSERPPNTTPEKSTLSTEETTESTEITTSGTSGPVPTRPTSPPRSTTLQPEEEDGDNLLLILLIVGLAILVVVLAGLVFKLIYGRN